MPKKLENALKKKAKKLFGTINSDKSGAYIYGTMSKMKRKMMK